MRFGKGEKGKGGKGGEGAKVFLKGFEGGSEKAERRDLEGEDVSFQTKKRIPRRRMVSEGERERSKRRRSR